ncbi:16361_t:CDS:2, partial [Racocetra persica]
GTISIMQEFLDSSIRGIPGIMRAHAEKVRRHKIKDDGSFVEEDTFVINTVGKNLYEISFHPAIDTSTMISSSVGEAYRLFGVEAACTKIVTETKAFMEDNTPNLRHLYLYAYEMTRTGKVTIKKATLEGAQNHIYGIAAHQLLGAIPEIGTMYNSVVIDEDFLKKNLKSSDSILDSL